MKKLVYKRIKSFISALVVISFLSMMFVENGQFSALGTDTSGISNVILNHIEYPSITDGVKEKRITTKTTDDANEENFVLEVDPTKVDIITGDTYADAPTNWGTSTVRQQAQGAIDKGQNVLAAINADFFAANGQPVGVYVEDGFVYKNTSTATDPNFFGVKNDGTAIIGDLSRFNEVSTELKYAVGAYHKLVVDGVVQTTFNGNGETAASIHPRTAIGIKADGKVIFYVTDGRQQPYSKGMNLAELSQTMKELGAVEAVNLDGGGSSTFMTKKLGTPTLELDNSPSDGYERSVTNSLLVVAKTADSGEFTGASITPEHKTYTVNSSVQFEATAFDKTGGSATLPPNTSWELEDPTMGTFSETGLFTSSGKRGQTQVFLKNQETNSVIGSTWIEIQNPDTIFFKSPEMSVEPLSETNLEVEAFYAGRPVIFNESELSFDVPTQIGTMNGKIFTANDLVGETADIIAKIGLFETTLKVTVGQLPLILADFENGQGGWLSSTAGAGTKSAIAVTDYANGEPVRFGDKSLKVDFDFTGSNPSSTNGVYAGEKDISSGKGVAIPGKPTAIGMWVYATPEAQGYWLRGTFRDANNSAKTIDFSSSINWLGWKYVEADVSMLNAPLSTFNFQTLRLLSTSAMVTAGLKLTKGSIYVDNVRAVYGQANDDFNPPIIKGTTIDTNIAGITEINTSFEDAEGSYVTGINYDRTVAYIDGTRYTDIEFDKLANKAKIVGLKLRNGKHVVEFVVQDNFGNETRQKQEFSIDATDLFEVSVVGNETAVLGKEYEIKVNVKEAAAFSDISTEMLFNSSFAEVEVNFLNPTGSSYTFEKGKLKLTAAIDETNSTATVATIKVKVPATIQAGTDMTYEMISSSLTAKVENGYFETFYYDKKVAPVVADLKVEVLSTVIGRDNTVKVLDLANNPVSGATVIITHPFGQFTGQTNAEGLATVGQFGGPGAVALKVQASKIDEMSFAVATQSFIPFHAGNTVVVAASQSPAPYNIIMNTTETQQATSITWFSSVIKSENNAIIQYKLKEDVSTSFTEKTGTTVEQEYRGSATLNNNGVVRINQVKLENLQPESEYVYRVGDGLNWSEEKEFKTAPLNDDDLNFIILGDTQTSDTTNLKSVLQAIDNDSTSYDFSMHVGDIVDNAGYYNEFKEVNEAIGKSAKLSSTPMVRALGNHEFMGDLNGTASKRYYDLPQNGPAADVQEAYSVTYGDAYIGVISWTTDEQSLKDQLEWIKEDKTKYNKKWTILLTHQPVYYTNPDGGNGLFKRIIPAYAKEIGFDFVFSGHDHAYGRTEEIDGTTYIVAGSTGTKYYDAVDDGSFIVYNDAKEPIYLTANIKDNRFTLNALRADGRIVDTYSKEKVFHEITTIANEGGIIIPNDNGAVQEGAQRTYTIRPTDGYIIEKVTVDGVEKGAIGEYRFESIDAAHTIEATFMKVQDNPDYMIGDTYILYATDFTKRLGESTFSAEAIIEYANVRVFDRITGLVVEKEVKVVNHEAFVPSVTNLAITLEVVEEPTTSKVIHANITAGSIPELTVPKFTEIMLNDAFDSRTGVTVTDTEDANLRESIVISGDYNIDVAGIYPISYSITDSDNNEVTKQQILLVNDGTYVHDNDYIINAKGFSVPSSSASLSEDDFIRLADVKVYDIRTMSWITNPAVTVDLGGYSSTPGVYTIRFNFNPTIEITVRVIAEETTAPVEETTAPVEETTTPVEETTTPVEEATTPVEETTTPVEETTTPVEETTTPVEKTTTPVEETMTPVEKNAEEKAYLPETGESEHILALGIILFEIGVIVFLKRNK